MCEASLVIAGDDFEAAHCIGHCGDKEVDFRGLCSAMASSWTSKFGLGVRMSIYGLHLDFGLRIKETDVLYDQSLQEMYHEMKATTG